MIGKPVVLVEVKNVLATSAGSAIFLGNDEKVFVIYVDHSVGSAINMFLHGTPKPRVCPGRPAPWPAAAALRPCANRARDSPP